MTVITTTIKKDIHQPTNTKDKEHYWPLEICFANFFLMRIKELQLGGNSDTASEDDCFIELGNGAKVFEYGYEDVDDNIDMYSYNHHTN